VKPKGFIVIGLSLAMALATWAAGQERSNDHHSTSGGNAGATASGPAPGLRGDARTRLEGQKRFEANCGRCHMSPRKFPPRMMATIIRHMRVRATLTDEDMHLILEFMTE
jgi:mono/diheme cytochrome c family protein